MATTTIDPIAGTPSQSGSPRRPSLFSRLAARLMDARTAEARRRIARLDPVYGRLLDAPDYVREAWINSGRWHEQG